jgi:hypothetical protein
MTNVKTEVIAMIEEMPEDADISDIMAELYFRNKVDRGLYEMDTGKGVPHAVVKEKLGKWLK